MSVIRFAGEEMKSGLKWLRSLLVFLLMLAFRLMIRLLFLGVFIVLLIGGWLIANHRINQEKKAVSNYLQAPNISGPVEIPAFYQAPKEQDISKRIRNGVSEARSWDYMVRSIKSDIERWTRK